MFTTMSGMVRFVGIGLAVLAVVWISVETSYGQRAEFQLSSPAFRHNESIPIPYTCNGANINPPLEIRNVPPDTKSLALTVEDVDDIPWPTQHWLVWNLEPKAQIIALNSKPAGASVGRNSFSTLAYNGPCSVYGTHRYYFKLYALDTRLNLKAEDTRRPELDKVMKSHILAQTILIGRYSQKPYAMSPGPVSR